MDHLLRFPSTFKDRWEELKPVIEKLWLNDKMKLAEVVHVMKHDHNFDAVEHQYKHRFKKWKWNKNISKVKKDKIAKQLESRACAGKASTNITLYGRTVEPHKIRRYMKMKTRDDSQNMVLRKPCDDETMVTQPTLPFANTIFLKWNVPFAAMRRSYTPSFDHASPNGFSVPTPASDIVVASPSSAASPQNAASLNTVLIRNKLAIDRAHLFAQGQHERLLKSLDGEERRIMADWLYQYWFFCFKTAKHWGKGPPAWTAELLKFDHFGHYPTRSLPGTPGYTTLQFEEQSVDVPPPTNLCRWFIHVWEEPYDALEEEDEFSNPTEQNPNDESTWQSWPSDWEEPPLPARLRDALEHNDFTSIPASTLPVAIPQLAKAAQKSPDELLLESLGFSIMSRNVEQVASLLERLDGERIGIKSLYPFHMATSYLDGFKACCDILSQLIRFSLLQGPREVYVNELGHTVLDNLMISILKSHSLATPAHFDNALKDSSRIVGEEVDICGRWDADSPCVRQHLATGNPSIPFHWKHKFCHTSIQTICHCIKLLRDHFTGGYLNQTLSGLYIQRCFDCGKKLQLRPLHSLVMTAYHLARKGCQDEDLFGILACLLCLISHGFDPRETAGVSVNALLQIEATGVECDHDQLTPAELAEKISVHDSLLDSWEEKARLGWEVFCGVLRLGEDASVVVEYMDDSDSSDHEYTEEDEDNTWDDFIGNTPPSGDFVEIHEHLHGTEIPCFRARRDLATLWASTQAEFLSYRRLDDNMSWTSRNFSMEELKGQLQRGEVLSVGFAKQGLLRTHCVCGCFDAPYHGRHALLSDATNPDIANLDI